MQTISKVKKYIEKHFLLADNCTVIVGVSGGADSMALLDILCKLGYKCIAAHCNFHLRESESDRDYLFVKKYCSENEIDFVSVDFDTRQYMEEHSVSLEMAARELRYTWFNEVKTRCKADKIAVAHHLNDSVETVLINLIRGTGIKGLTGIAPANENTVRPLLCLYRNEIIDYLKQYNIDFVVDSTNNESIYTRNKIRLDIIPLLETINPAAVENIQRTSENLSSAEKIYNDSVSRSIGNVFSDNKINIGLLMQENEPQTILFEILFPYGFNADAIQDIFNSVKSQPGKIFYSNEYTLVRDRDSFVLRKTEEKNDDVYFIDKTDLSVYAPVKLIFKNILNDESFCIEKKRNIIYVDKDKLKFPLTVRRWRQGDRFAPFGMKGFKKLSDYFTDQKFSLFDKDEVWLLISDNKIVWIIGERADDRFKVTESTVNVLKITKPD